MCSVPGCGEKHSRFININTVIPHVKNGHVSTNNLVYMPVVPVTINATYKNYVLLDTASTNIFVTRNGIDVLGISGKQVSNTLCALNSANNDLCELVEIKLMSAINDNSTTCSAYVIDAIPVSSPKIDVRKRKDNLLPPRLSLDGVKWSCHSGIT